MEINGLPFTGVSGRKGDYVKPLWTINLDDPEEFLKWAKEAIENLEDDHRERTRNDLRNEDFYEGYQSMSIGKEGIPRDREGRPIDKFSRVVVNQIYELTEQKVAKMTRFAPAIAVLAQSSEYSDKVNAKLSKQFIDHLFYLNEMDEKLEDVARKTRLNGEVFLFITYDQSKGDYATPDAKASATRTEVLDSNGDAVVDEKNEPLLIEQAQKTGEVVFDVVLRRYILREPKPIWGDVDWIIQIKPKTIAELRAENPDLASEIKASRADLVDMFKPSSQEGEVLEYTLYHRSTKFLDKGRKIRFTSEIVLENTVLPYSHGQLPCVRLSDMDVNGDQYGRSFIDQIILLQIIYNNLVSIGYTNASLGSHLYWLVPHQANVDIKQLRNSSSVIKYAAGFPPTLQQFRTIGTELFQLIDFFNTSLLRTSAIQDISRGEVPPGIEAGVALTFLEEQENQRANTDIKKHNKFIQKVAKMAISVAGDYYKADQQRTIRVVGKNNQYVIKTLDKAKLSGSYDIRVNRTTALSESKAGRISQILAIQGRFPDMVPKEQVMDMLELSNDEKYYDLTTSAVQTAEKENEDMSEGIPVPAAQPYEELHVHWYSHMKFMQSSEFKDFPPQVKSLFLEHLSGTEFLIFDKMTGNQLYAQMIAMQYPSFPCVLTQAAYQASQPLPTPVSSGLSLDTTGAGGMAPGGMPGAPNLNNPLVAGAPTGDSRSLAEPVPSPDNGQQMDPVPQGEAPTQ